MQDIEKQDGTSFLKTTFNGLNTLLGAAILSTPFALLSGGWLSLILLFAIAITTFYTGLLIKRCMDVDPSIRTYPDIGHNAFGPKGSLVISIFMYLELYLVATGFLILAGDNLHNMFPNMGINLGGVIVIGGRKTFVLLVVAFLMPTAWIDNMSTLSYLSATGVLASVVILGSVLWSGMYHDVGFHPRSGLFNLGGLPTSLSLYALCFCGHPVFPTLYASMRNPQRFSWVLFLCFLLCVLTYGAMAVVGFLMFGSRLQSQITLNLPRYRLSSKLATYTALINPLSKYGLILKPIFETIETRYRFLCRRRCYTLLARSILVGSTAVVALTIPFYGYLMSFVGAFTTVAVSILFPCVCYLKIYGSYRKLSLEYVIIAFTVLLGLIVLVVGTYTALVEIIHNLFSHS